MSHLIIPIPLHNECGDVGVPLLNAHDDVGCTGSEFGGAAVVLVVQAEVLKLCSHFPPLPRFEPLPPPELYRTPPRPLELGSKHCTNTKPIQVT